MRINKYLASCGLGSRRYCEKFIIQNKIKINNEICNDLAYIVKDNDVVKFNDVILKPVENKIYYKFYKPSNVITSLKDDKGRKDVNYYLKKNNITDRVFPIGRLDFDSEGLIILTNDGIFANMVAHPKYQIDKEYRVKIKDKLTDEMVTKLENGIELSEGTTSKSRIKNININEKYSVFTIIIHQGWNRQIRRMIEKVNSTVLNLKRVRIGNIKLENIKQGEIKTIKTKLIDKLKNDILKLS